MARLFDITTTSDVLTLDSSGKGKLVFTVTNTTDKPQRGTLRARALDSAQAEWLAINGEFERDFSAGFTHQVELAVTAPAGTPAGRFRVRLDAFSVANPEEDFTEGPAIAVIVPAVGEAPKKSLWWVWLIVGLVLLIIVSVVLYLVLRDPDPDPGPPPPPPPASKPAPTKPKPVTKEFNDPRVKVGSQKFALDICRESGNNCGKPVADAFCKSKGMATAVDFRMAMDSPPTVVWSSKQICSTPGCDRLTWIKCSSSTARASRVNSTTRKQLDLLKNQGQHVPE